MMDSFRRPHWPIRCLYMHIYIYINIVCLCLFRVYRGCCLLLWWACALYNNTKKTTNLKKKSTKEEHTGSNVLWSIDWWSNGKRYVCILFVWWKIVCTLNLLIIYFINIYDGIERKSVIMYPTNALWLYMNAAEDRSIEDTLHNSKSDQRQIDCVWYKSCTEPVIYIWCVRDIPVEWNRIECVFIKSKLETWVSARCLRSAGKEWTGGKRQCEMNI